MKAGIATLFRWKAGIVTLFRQGYDEQLDRGPADQSEARNRSQKLSAFVEVCGLGMKRAVCEGGGGR